MLPVYRYTDIVIMSSIPALKIAIIGGGWYGCHIALELKKDGHDVEIFDKSGQIFDGISGTFGIRLHKGPHYPRSKMTRDTCRKDYSHFCRLYPNLLIHHERAMYGHSKLDAHGFPNKVTQEHFHNVCHESPECEVLDHKAEGWPEVNALYSLDENSVVVGESLREAIQANLEQAGIKVQLNCEVHGVQQCEGHVRVHLNNSSHEYDIAINATAYASLIPNDLLPDNIGVAYQSAIGLVYEDLSPGKKPFSFIIMDGAYPCIMPIVTVDNSPTVEYLIIHGTYTIMGSFNTPEKAAEHLAQLTDSVMNTKIKPLIDHELEKVWPRYHERFVYRGWKGAVIAKLRTRSEFRSSLTFEKDDVIYIFPGKINNVVTAARETRVLVEDIVRRRQEVPISSNKRDNVVNSCGVRFAADGTMALALGEIGDKPLPGEPHTTNIQTFLEL
ncbi:hypothetical protein FE257_003570 [Aspergillus nanangensis]|uniref:FAD dependent oxidoreductase domain-containing protein n=1 Tax=Aspergillus nanangensis TaxID=2582783 RepID=A0AAD4CBE4_ASPNN|nr:hypothetical protein FE257_003570 [Aspergillus nanangensis]